jgi:cupin 2 domain-containing protein
MSEVRHGRLRDPAEAPAAGEELFLELLAHRNLVVEQILSGASDEPADYLQEQDEWVVVLAGGAALAVDGEKVELGPGDWVFLPAGVPHTVLRTDAGTCWLAVHLHAAD